MVFLLHYVFIVQLFGISRGCCIITSYAIYLIMMESVQFPLQTAIKNTDQGTVENRESMDELDAVKNRQLFRDLPCSDLQFFAIHLARPESFLKILATGQIATSTEIREKFGKDFSKTHRGHFMMRGEEFVSSANDYISFSIGLPKPEYGSSRRFITDDSEKTDNGMGFILKTENLFKNPGLARAGEVGGPIMGTGDISAKLDNFQSSDRYEPHLEDAVKYLREWSKPTDIEISEMENILHVARKRNSLNAINTPEVHLYSPQYMDPNRDQDVPEVPARLPLSQTLVLIPRKTKPLLIKALQLTINKLRVNKQGLQELFSVDTGQLSVEAVLGQYHIYWYPQSNITEAVEYLSTHKERFNELFG